MVESMLHPPWLNTQGRKDGRYVIGPLLGHGAMGDVHEAWDTILARPVALKILKHLEPAAMIRFMHEAQLHARVDLPNICRIYDVDASNGTPRIAMQLVRGPTLEDAAQELSLREVVAILAQVAEALHGAHQLNLIHRDIKPSNILLQWGGPSGWVPFICDFGLAMALDGPAVTQPLAMTGTPAYMAPEQVRGDRTLIGPPTDVYGIGSTLYFTLVGRPPCVTTTTTEMLRVKRERRFPSPRSLEPEIPPGLEAILFKCLEPSPQERYASTAELAQALRGILDTLGPAQPLAVSGSRWNWRRTGRPALILALVLAGALPVLIGILQHRRQRAEEMSQTIALEATSLEQSIRNERMLPAHDLRPADARTRSRMAALMARAASLGPGAAGPVHLALGQAHFLLQDLPQAKEELEQAWAAGQRGPDTAFLLAQVHAQEYRTLLARAEFLGRPAPPEAEAARGQAGQYLALARMQTRHPREFALALEQALNGEHARAAAEARDALKANPWHLESAILACASLERLARERFEAGDREGATRFYDSALDQAREALARGQSDPRLQHSACAAALGRAAVALDGGTLSPESLGELEDLTGQALLVAPAGQEAQSDWLQARSLGIQRSLALGQDPGRELDQALQFYWTRTRAPRSLELQLDHMVLYGLQAERDFERGEDPGPSLAEALKDPGRSPDRHRDVQADLWILKARVEAAQGRDPRPSLETAVGLSLPADQGRTGPGPCECAARAWLLRAEWERLHGIDAEASLDQAQGLLRRALDLRPSATAFALQGLGDSLRAATHPAERATLLARAREHLRSSNQLNPRDRDLIRLRKVLAEG